MRRLLTVLATFVVAVGLPGTSVAATSASPAFSLAAAQAWPGLITWGTLTGAFNANFPGWIQWDGGSHIAGPFSLKEDPTEIKFTIPKDASIGAHTIAVRHGYGELMATIATTQIEVVPPPPPATITVYPLTVAPNYTVHLSATSLPSACAADPFNASLDGHELPVSNHHRQPVEYGQTGVVLIDATATVAMPANVNIGEHTIGFACADQPTAFLRVLAPAAPSGQANMPDSPPVSTTPPANAPPANAAPTNAAPASEPPASAPPAAAAVQLPPQPAIPWPTPSPDPGPGPHIAVVIGTTAAILLLLLGGFMYRLARRATRHPIDFRVAAHVSPVSIPTIHPAAGQTLHTLSLRTALAPETHTMKELAP